jgi:hypothetical protein
MRRFGRAVKAVDSSSISAMSAGSIPADVTLYYFFVKKTLGRWGLQGKEYLRFAGNPLRGVSPMHFSFVGAMYVLFFSGLTDRLTPDAPKKKRVQYIPIDHGPQEIDGLWSALSCLT